MPISSDELEDLLLPSDLAKKLLKVLTGLDDRIAMDSVALRKLANRSDEAPTINVTPTLKAADVNVEVPDLKPCAWSVDIERDERGMASKLIFKPCQP